MEDIAWPRGEYEFSHLVLVVSLTRELNEDEILISKRPVDALFIMYAYLQDIQIKWNRRRRFLFILNALQKVFKFTEVGSVIENV